MRCSEQEVSRLPLHVLFVCTENSVRSQMAEALLQHFGGTRFIAYSAGIHPTRVHPLAIAVMEEIGIDLRTHRAKYLSAVADESLDIVITFTESAREGSTRLAECAERRHWSLPDPTALGKTDAERRDAFRWVRNKLAREIQTFVETHEDRPR